MSQNGRIFLNLAGEFAVASELNRRHVLASVTYGASKSADIFATNHDMTRIVRIEVKATDKQKKKKWPIGFKATKVTPQSSNVVWVLVFFPSPRAQVGIAIPEVRRQDIEFPADEKPKAQPFFFDADTATRIINAAPYPFKLMFLIAATCGLRIGEVTALKASSLDFKQKVIHITAALDYVTRKECVPKSANSAAPLPMSALLEQYLRTWLEKHIRPSPEGYLFLNAAGRPYLSDKVVRKIHSIMDDLQIARPEGGVHVGIHCFRHGVTSELLQAGIPIHLVTRMMRHSDPHVTLAHYAHVIGDSERALREALAANRRPIGVRRRIGVNFDRQHRIRQLFGGGVWKSNP